MHDIALLMVRFGQFLKVVILHFKWYLFDQKGRFTH